MTTNESKSLQAREKSEVSSSMEQTRPGPVFTPTVDIFETPENLTLVADLPGVTPDDLNIDLKDSILTLSGEVAQEAGKDEQDILREYRTGTYLREFTLSEMIDQQGIEAKLKDGVLTLTLPKVKAATPRKVTVKAT
ncbi:MAG: Hsp20/alpha crystallin family protein [Deltaproteobacteria bacterium]|nr:Hsp20/alpha crystallin family protein [Deltaproteobacteria bacterium]